MAAIKELKNKQNVPYQPKKLSVKNQTKTPDSKKERQQQSSTENGVKTRRWGRDTERYYDEFNASAKRAAGGYHSMANEWLTARRPPQLDINRSELRGNGPQHDSQREISRDMREDAKRHKNKQLEMERKAKRGGKGTAKSTKDRIRESFRYK